MGKIDQKKATETVAYKRNKKISYFLTLPSPRMIHLALKGEFSSNLNAYLGSIFLIRPESH